MTIDPGHGFRALLRPHTGVVTEIRPTARGFATDLAAVVVGEGERFFVKAMRNRPGGRRDQILREKAINPFVRSLAPALLWTAEDEEWIAIGFEAIEARCTEFSPGSPDLPIVVDLLCRIGRLGLPGVVRDWPETRWDWWADEGAAALFKGDALLHTDINEGNFLIGAERSWVVDWSWPTQGAAFIDPAMFVVQLVAAGHSPEEAEAWAAGCPAWAWADPKAIDAFAVAYARMIRVRAMRKPEESWLAAMADAIEAWARYRGITKIM
ncbi:protein kinase [Streptomyces aidingensis]|uniref:Phosphotransferase enzyme family protein n=1 Tax=Streptomyces aidingensis TaxID=910347 RepID=A0A1I1GQL1_9ACTN|nr:protein kinase [Streptomyces aidingensis]SFC14069.1 hypothetical protein SAMN05421773_102103 [Streptomyces aidingensis]